MSGLSEAQKHFNKFFPKKPIAYQPGLSLVFDSVPVGILLSQLLYWQGKQADREGWIYKTAYNLMQETGLSRDQQSRAVEKLKSMGILETKLKRIPATKHFKLNVEILEKLLPSLKQNAHVDYLDPPAKFAGKPQTITKSTHETNTNNTHSALSPNGPASIGEILDETEHYAFRIPINED